MMIRAVIFDLDGTLFNSIEDIADANNAMLRNHGFPEHTLESYIGWIGNGAGRLVRASLPSLPAGDPEHFGEYLKEYSARYAEGIAMKSHLYPGISTLLDYLVREGIALSVNTNKPQYLTELVHKKYLSSWPFPFVFGQSERFPMKPDPAAALFIAERIGARPDEVLFIGDSEVDIQTAYAARMIPVGVTWGYGSVYGLQDKANGLVADRPEEIIDFIQSKYN